MILKIIGTAVGMVDLIENEKPFQFQEHKVSLGHWAKV